MPRVVMVVATVVVALALAGTVSAGGQAPQGYHGPGESVQAQVRLGGQQPPTSGTLPFSGQDLTLLVGGGTALILAGASFYRLSRRRS